MVRMTTRAFGKAKVAVLIGDPDGSGSVAVSLEIQHDHGCVAVALSAAEAETISRALDGAAARVRPHQRLGVRLRELMA